MRVELHGLDMLLIYYSATFVDFHQGRAHVSNLLKKRPVARMVFVARMFLTISDDLGHIMACLSAESTIIRPTSKQTHSTKTGV